MDTVTCATCSAEILGDNVDAHFEWHEAQDRALARARELSLGEAALDEPSTAPPAPDPSTPREELSEEFGEESDSGARTQS